MKLSIIIPTINIDKMKPFLRFLNKNVKTDYEVIIVSPYPLHPDVLNLYPNTKYINDWGSPVRCQQRALLACDGEYVTRMVDDGIYNIDGIDIAMQKASPDTIVNMKFIESNKAIDLTHKDCQIPIMAEDKFYYLEYHKQTLQRYTPAHFQVINFGIYPIEVLKKLGGWDCQFEGIALAELDLSIRAQLAEFKVILTDGIVLNCGWTPGEEGNHAPMHHAFFEDMKKYITIYNLPSYEDRIFIDINNWEKAPARWLRRFGS